jgi:hypothetical protein
MADQENDLVVKIRGIDGGEGGLFIALALLAIFFKGEPGLVDALIRFLMRF